MGLRDLISIRGARNTRLSKRSQSHVGTELWGKELVKLFRIRMYDYVKLSYNVYKG